MNELGGINKKSSVTFDERYKAEADDLFMRHFPLEIYEFTPKWRVLDDSVKGDSGILMMIRGLPELAVRLAGTAGVELYDGRCVRFTIKRDRKF